MAKVTINTSTPSQKIIEKSQQQMIAKDANGRVIKLKIPDVLEEFDLHAALGAESSNVGVLSMASALLYVEEIDGEKFLSPRTYQEVRAGLKRLDRDGIKAVIEALQNYNLIREKGDVEQISEIKK